LARVDQFVPSFARHDAIGNHVRQLQRVLRAAGYDSDIWFEHLDARLEGMARPYRECDPTADPDRLILYHASTDSGMCDWLLAAIAGGQRVALYYHNITPAEYFAAWEPEAARSMVEARAQLARLAPAVHAGLAASAYNAAELEALGLAGTEVCPLLLDLAEYHQAPDRRAAGSPSGSPRWLFVGRIAPNKCQHDVIAAFAIYRRLYAPDARLALAGGVTSGRYQQALVRLAAELGVTGAVEFAGSLPFAGLLGQWAAADLFVCLSEHEGFCVPVIEAMELGVPVLAHAAAAVPDTVGDAGVLLAAKDPLAVAVAAHELLSDPSGRAALVAAGRRRAAEFALEPSARRWLAALDRIGPGRGAAGPPAATASLSAPSSTPAGESP
jgi:glycosyltransferase involved in cell wall biosynthesis